MYMYIYIYIERERETYIYIYTNIERECIYNVCIYIYMCCICMCIMYMCIHVYSHMCVYIYIYIYISYIIVCMIIHIVPSVSAVFRLAVLPVCCFAVCVEKLDVVLTMLSTCCSAFAKYRCCRFAVLRSVWKNSIWKIWVQYLEALNFQRVCLVQDLRIDVPSVSAVFRCTVQMASLVSASLVNSS